MRTTGMEAAWSGISQVAAVISRHRRAGFATTETDAAVRSFGDPAESHVQRVSSERLQPARRAGSAGSMPGSDARSLALSCAAVAAPPVTGWPDAPFRGCLPETPGTPELSDVRSAWRPGFRKGHLPAAQQKNTEGAAGCSAAAPRAVQPAAQAQNDRAATRTSAALMKVLLADACTVPERLRRPPGLGR